MKDREQWVIFKQDLLKACKGERNIFTPYIQEYIENKEHFMNTLISSHLLLYRFQGSLVIVQVATDIFIRDLKKYDEFLIFMVSEYFHRHCKKIIYITKDQIQDMPLRIEELELMNYEDITLPNSEVENFVYEVIPSRLYKKSAAPFIFAGKYHKTTIFHALAHNLLGVDPTLDIKIVDALDDGIDLVNVVKEYEKYLVLFIDHIETLKTLSEEEIATFYTKLNEMLHYHRLVVFGCDVSIDDFISISPELHQLFTNDPTADIESSKFPRRLSVRSNCGLVEINLNEDYKVYVSDTKHVGDKMVEDVIIETKHHRYIFKDVYKGVFYSNKINHSILQHPFAPSILVELNNTNTLFSKAFPFQPSALIVEDID